VVEVLALVFVFVLVLVIALGVMIIFEPAIAFAFGPICIGGALALVAVTLITSDLVGKGYLA
jgi:hypothetical protein